MLVDAPGVVERGCRRRVVKLPGVKGMSSSDASGQNVMASWSEMFFVPILKYTNKLLLVRTRLSVVIISHQYRSWLIRLLLSLGRRGLCGLYPSFTTLAFIYSSYSVSN